MPDVILFNPLGSSDEEGLDFTCRLPAGGPAEVIDVGDENVVQYFSAFVTDFCDLQVINSEEWACLLGWAYDAQNFPAIFKIGSGLKGSGSAPVAYSDMLCYDTSFRGGANSLRFIYNDDGGGHWDGGKWVAPFYLCDFDFAAESYGTPFGSFEVTREGYGFKFRLAKRPDGSYLLVFTQYTGGSDQLCYSVYDGSWTHYGAICAANGLRHLRIDSTGRAHVLFTGAGYTKAYLQIAADNTPGTPVDLSGLSAPIGDQGNLDIDGDTLILPGLGYLLKGVGLASPSWSEETIDAASGIDDYRSYRWTVEDNKIVVYWTHAFYADPQRIYKSTRNAENDWSAAETVWDFAVDPPDGMTTLQQVDAISFPFGAAVPSAVARAFMAEAGSPMLSDPGYNVMIYGSKNFRCKAVCRQRVARSSEARHLDGRKELASLCAAGLESYRAGPFRRQLAH